MTRTHVYAFVTLFFCVACLAKPAKDIADEKSLDPVKAESNNTDESVREQRSPQFGLLTDYDDDYSDYDDTSRHLKFGNRHKHYKGPHGHPGFHGGPHGCHGYGCGGGHHGQYPGGYHPPGHTGSGASFATASAGSINAGKPFGGGHSQANSQSASFSIGPYTASFSASHAFSAH